MSAASIYDAILDAVAAAITGLGLTFNSSPIPVNVLKLPKAEETLETLPAIQVSPTASGETEEPWSSEDQVLVKYPVQVTLLASGARDFTETNLDTWMLFRQKCRRLFQGALLSGVVSVFKTDLRFAPVLDRGELKNSYEIGSFTVVFWSIETRQDAVA